MDDAGAKGIEEEDVQGLNEATSTPLEVWPGSIQGYEHTTTYQPVCLPPPTDASGCPSYLIGVPPPPYEEVMRDERERARNAANGSLLSMTVPEDELEGKVQRISEEEANDALMKFVSSNCCYNRGLPKQIKTNGFHSSCGYLYVLETFYEERSTSWKQEPLINQIIDGPGNGHSPTGWEVEVTPPNMFQDKEINRELPHTAYVSQCSQCVGKGKVPCSTCRGTGNVKCGICDGLGLLFRHNCQDGITGFESHSVSAPRHCHDCSGGRTTCKPCIGRGTLQCKTCDGHCSLKMYNCLTVRWKTLHARKVFDTSKLPEKCINSVSGTTVYEDQNTYVYPLYEFSHEEINSYSQKMIITHKDQSKHGHILSQRHYVQEIPIAEVVTEWKSKEFTYWVYGKEHQVYFPDYPSKCCIL